MFNNVKIVSSQISIYDSWIKPRAPNRATSPANPITVRSSQNMIWTVRSGRSGCLSRWAVKGRESSRTRSRATLAALPLARASPPRARSRPSRRGWQSSDPGDPGTGGVRARRTARSSPSHPGAAGAPMARAFPVRARNQAAPVPAIPARAAAPSTPAAVQAWAQPPPRFPQLRCNIWLPCHRSDPDSPPTVDLQPAWSPWMVSILPLHVYLYMNTCAGTASGCA